MALRMVLDYGPGKGKTKICDDFCVKTKEETEKILQNVGEIFYAALCAKYLRGELTDEQKQKEQDTEGSNQSDKYTVTVY